MYIVNNSNYQQFLVEAGQHRHPHTGEPCGRGLFPADQPREDGRMKAGFGEVPNAAPMAEMDLIPMETWPDLIAKKDRDNSWLVDKIGTDVPCTDQDGLSYCWVFCSKQTIEVARRIQNNPYIPVSAVSVGGPINSWRNAGGWPEDAIKRWASVGGCRESLTAGPWSLRPTTWDKNWEADCQNFKLLEWDDGSFNTAALRWQAQMTLTLHSRPHTLEFTWWSHAIAGGYKAKNLGNGKFTLLMRNNWGQWGETVNGGTGYVWMESDKGVSDAVFAPRSVTPYEQ